MVFGTRPRLGSGVTVAPLITTNAVALRVADAREDHDRYRAVRWDGIVRRE
jgi:hypothetical protein